MNQVIQLGDPAILENIASLERLRDSRDTYDLSPSQNDYLISLYKEKDRRDYLRNMTDLSWEW